MGSYKGLALRRALGRGITLQKIDDAPVAFRMRYKGTGTVTSVIVVTGTGITMITSDGGTDSYAFATYTTIGLLVDAINADGIFEARVLDALRADATNGSQLVDATISATLKSEGYLCWDVLVDTSVKKAITVRLTPDVERQFTGMRKDHRVSLKEIKYSVNVSAAEAKAVRVYDIVDSTETLIWSAASVDSTGSVTVGLTTVTFAGGYGKITAADGHELLVRVQDATSLTDSSTNFLRVVGFAE